MNLNENSYNFLFNIILNNFDWNKSIKKIKIWRKKTNIYHSNGIIENF